MQILTAESHFGASVWRNGHEVSDLCGACQVPNKPGRLGIGWTDVLLPTPNATRWNDFQVDDKGLPIFRRKWGLVRWAPTKSQRDMED